MRRPIISLIVIAAVLSLVALTTLSRAGAPRSESGSNAGLVMLETEGSAGVSVRMAEELARATNDGKTRRVLPVIGGGCYRTLWTSAFYLASMLRAWKQTSSSM